MVAGNKVRGKKSHRKNHSLGLERKSGNQTKTVKSSTIYLSKILKQ